LREANRDCYCRAFSLQEYCDKWLAPLGFNCGERMETTQSYIHPIRPTFPFQAELRCCEVQCSADMPLFRSTSHASFTRYFHTSGLRAGLRNLFRSSAPPSWLSPSAPSPVYIPLGQNHCHSHYPHNRLLPPPRPPLPSHPR
jgi:hypothetical protein